MLAGADWIDELWVYHTEDIDTFAKRIGLLKKLRARRFDVWIDIPNDLSTVPRQFRDMAFARLARPAWARGWRINMLRWAAQSQSEYLSFPNEVDRTLGLIRRLGFEVGKTEFALPRLPEVKARVQDLLSSRRLVSDRLIAIAPGATRATNLWIPERFVEVGQELSRHHYAIVLIAGKSEAGMCAQIAEQIGAQAHSFAGKLSVAESCELLRRCSLAVCLDSGVQHLASAVGTPCVSLFSFWQLQGKWHPYGPKNVVIQKWVACHTCLLEKCPRNNLCMKAISVADVTEAACQVLRAPASQS